MGEQSAHPEETAVVDPTHPLLTALQPLLERVQGRVVAPDDMGADDVPLVWDGDLVAGVRLPPPTAGASEAVGDLGRLLNDLADELGAPLARLSRAEKQRAVRLLEERGAFTYRKSAETVAEALGVSRFTVYNYLNRTDS
jgi:hypothetical protein